MFAHLKIKSKIKNYEARVPENPPAPEFQIEKNSIEKYNINNQIKDKIKDKIFNNSEDLMVENVQPVFLSEVKFEQVFRFNRKFWKKLNNHDAIAIERMNDLDADFLEVDKNENKVVIVGVETPAVVPYGDGRADNDGFDDLCNPCAGDGLHFYDEEELTENDLDDLGKSNLNLDDFDADELEELKRMGVQFPPWEESGGDFGSRKSLEINKIEINKTDESKKDWDKLSEEEWNERARREDDKYQKSFAKQNKNHKISLDIGIPSQYDFEDWSEFRDSMK